MSDNLFTKAQESLQKYWGFPSFRPGQDKVIQAVLDGKNTMVLFPTGGGKSLCYQVYCFGRVDGGYFSVGGAYAGSGAAVK